MKKALVLMLAVLLLGTVGMAQTRFFETIIVEISATLADLSASGLADLDGGIAVDTNVFTLDGTTGKIVLGGAWGITPIDLDGTDPNQAVQFHADITTDVASGAYATTYETLTVTNNLTNDTSIFGNWAELYITGDLTIAVGNQAASWGHLELIDGGANLTLNSSVTELWSAGVVGSLIIPDGLIVGQDRQIAAVIATSDITTGYSLGDDALLAGVLIRADGQPFPVGLLIDDDDATIDIQLSNDQLIDGSTLGTIVANKCTAVEYAGAAQKTVLTFTLTGDHDIDTPDGGQSKGVQVYDFPAGYIQILGALIDCSVVTNAVYNADTNDQYFISVGTVDGTQAADADLTSTEADIIPKTTHDTDSSGANTQLTNDWHAEDLTLETFDGTGTAMDLYVNVAVPDANNTGATTHEVTGTLTIFWINHGDY